MKYYKNNLGFKKKEVYVRKIGTGESMRGERKRPYSQLSSQPCPMNLINCPTATHYDHQSFQNGWKGSYREAKRRGSIGQKAMGQGRKDNGGLARWLLGSKPEALNDPDSFWPCPIYPALLTFPDDRGHRSMVNAKKIENSRS